MTVLLVIIYVSFISLGLPDSVLGSIWPQMHMELHAGVSLAGYISMTITAGTVVSSVFSDRIVRRFGTGWVTAVSVAMTALGLAGFSLAPNVAVLFLCAVPLGLGAGSVDVALNNFVALHYEAKHMNWLHCFWGIGASAGPVIASLCLNAGASWRMGYGVIAGIQAALCAVLFASLPQWRRTGGIPAAAEETADAAHGSVLRQRGVLPVLGGFILYCAIEATGGLWSATFVFDRFKIAASEAAIVSTIYYGAETVGRMLAGFASMRWSDRTMIRVGLGILMLGAVTTLCAQTVWLAMAGIAMVGLGLAPIYPAMLHATPARFGAERSQQVMGMEMAFAYVGSTCFPPIFGALTSFWGTGLYPGFLMGCILLAVGMTETANYYFKRK